VTQPPHGLPPLANTTPVWRRSWVPVAHSCELPDDTPLQALVAGDAWVITRMDGTLTAFDDQCPHRSSPLSAGCVTRVGDGTPRLVCAAHGWRFDVTGYCDLAPGGDGWHHRRRPGGRWKHHEQGVGTRLIPAFGITERYGLIWLAAEEPLTPLPDFPEWTDEPGGVRAHSARTLASAGQVLDHFLAAAAPRAGTVTAEGWRIAGTLDITPYGGVASGSWGVVTAGPHGTVHFRVPLPHATLGILVSCQPEDWGSTRVFRLITRGDLTGDGAAVDRIAAQDDGVLEGVLTRLDRDHSPLLPLDAEPGAADGEPPPLNLAWRRIMGRAMGW
jgi:vanillate O-demethylase monooxygenase subunit